MKILAVIPARGGSKGIPRKNVRMMHGKPLISYAICNAQNCASVTDIAVTTDDPEVMAIARIYGAQVIRRKPELAADDITLDPVIDDAVMQMEKRCGYRYDAVITLQPTSPLLTGATLDKAVEVFLKEGKDTLISVVNHAHLSWRKEGQQFVPNYQARRNRQQLPADYMETGAFFITKREFVTRDSRLGKHVSVYEVPSREAVDIDTADDWLICEHALKQKRIVFRADGYQELGMGHIYHCLTLALRMTGQEIVFVTNKNHKEGYEKLKESYLPVYGINTEKEFYEFLKGYRADIVVNDCLNTTKEHILQLKRLAGRVITIEDLGEGAVYADAVINALYHTQTPRPNEYVGAGYVCIRDEFFMRKPKEFSERIRNVLVMFGGTDPSNLTKKIYGIARKLHAKEPEMELHFILGCGYPADKNNMVTDSSCKLFVHTDVRNVSQYMQEADLAFTSQGRTVFELAVMGVPAIVMAQNKREQLHTFAQMENGFLNLGLGTEVSESTLLSTFCWLAKTPQIRREMRELMLKNRLDKSTDRVLDIILKEP